jgi:hypothetical protein
VQNVIGILIGIALDMQTAFGRMAIFTMLILPVHKCEDLSIFDAFFSFSLQWFIVFIYLFSVVSFVKFIPRYFIVF